MVQVKQECLFKYSSEGELYKTLKFLPKIDLHRHLTGTITARTAIEVASSHDLPLPTWVEADLEAIITKKPVAKQLPDYFEPWRFLNKLFSRLPAVKQIVRSAVRDAAEDNVVYLELRMAPQGFLGDTPCHYRFEDFIEEISTTVRECERDYNVITRCILGVPRHTFKKVPLPARIKMFWAMIDVISRATDCFVGVDLNGVEDVGSPADFSSFFEMAADRGLGITIHAGEVCGASGISEAVTQLGARRIGHGVAAALDCSVMRLLSDRNCLLEICPTSNVLLGIFDAYREIPLPLFEEMNVPFAICTDNPGRCRSSLTEELLRLSLSFGFDPPRYEFLMARANEYSFASDEVRREVSIRLNGIHLESEPQTLIA